MYAIHLQDFIARTTIHVKTGLSITLIVKNEAENLPGLFSSILPLQQKLSPNFEIVLIDTGSTDATVAIAKQFGAKVDFFKWIDDFSKARNFGIQQCMYSHIMWLDADDFLPTKTVNYLIEYISKQFQNDLTPKSSEAYTFCIQSKLATGGDSEFLQTRLFPAGHNIEFSHPIHETLGPSLRQANISIVASGHTIEHRGYANEQVLEQKSLRNQNLLEKLIQQNNALPSHRFSLARTYHVNGEYQKALGLYQELAQAEYSQEKISDISLASIIYAGQALGMMGLVEQAEKWFDIFLSKGKTHTQYLFEYGKILWIKGGQHQAKSKEFFLIAQKIGPIHWSIPTAWNEIMQGIAHFLNDSKHTANKMSFSDVNSTAWKKISVLTIVKNDLSYLKDLAKDLPIHECEWIVLDTGSTDGTLNYLQTLPVKIFQSAWEGDFSKARNLALSYTSRPWVLWLDADDRLPKETVDWIASGIFENSSLPHSNEAQSAYRLMVESPRDDGSRELARQVRLFPNHKGIVWEGKVHESLSPSIHSLNIKVIDAHVYIQHMGYYHAEHRKAKALRNEELLKIEWAEHLGNPYTALQYGNTLYQLGKYREAMTIYQAGENAVNLRERTRYCFLRRMGLCYRALADNDAAIECFNQQIIESPDDTESWYNLGKICIEKNDISSALKMFWNAGTTKEIHSDMSGDIESLRQNSYGYYILLAMTLKEVPSDNIYQGLEYLLNNITKLPFDYEVPADFYQRMGDVQSLKKYAQLCIQHHLCVEKVNDWLGR